jgi:futalosine hydrolase
MIPDICTMRILLAAATSFEIQPTIDFIGRCGVTSPGGASSTGVALSPGVAPSTGVASSTEVALSPGVEIDTLVTGVGSLATAWSLMRQIATRRPDIIIQAGIAGCFTQLPFGTVVVVGEDLVADEGVWEDRRFKSIFDLKLASPDTPPFTGGLLVNPHKDLVAKTDLATVRGITVNEITTEPIRIAWYQQNTAPVVESMEGAALHYICLREQIAFLQFRSVSNDIGERDKSKWDIKKAIGHLNDRLIATLKKM